MTTPRPIKLTVETAQNPTLAQRQQRALAEAYQQGRSKGKKGGAA